MQHLEPGHKILDVVEIAQGQACEQRALERDGPELVGRRRAAVREPQPPVREPGRDRRVFLTGEDPDGTAGTQVNGGQSVGIGGQSQSRSRVREFDEERPAFQGDDAPDPELGIEAVGEVVPCGPGRYLARP